MTNPTAEATTTYPTGAEVTITLTARVVHSSSGRLIVEYVKANGYADRIGLDATSSNVTITPTGGPDQATLAARERAARMVAVSCLDDEDRQRTAPEWVDRWNDAYPAGTPVCYLSSGSWTNTTTTSDAFLLFDNTAAVVRVEGAAIPIGLRNVEPVTTRV